MDGSISNKSHFKYEITYFSNAGMKVAYVSAMNEAEAGKKFKRDFPAISSESIQNVKMVKPNQPIFQCTSCGFITSTPLQKGQKWLEIVLWLLYILPGLVYSIWRRNGGGTVCPNCKHETLIPYNPDASLDSREKSEAVQRQEIECSWCAEPILEKAKICKHCGKETKA